MDIPPIIADSQREGWTPVAADERIKALDVLRGFAVLGILTVNMVAFSWPMDQMIPRQLVWVSRRDILADWVIRFLAEGKFHPLFALLFGLGAAIQMEWAVGLVLALAIYSAQVLFGIR